MTVVREPERPTVRTPQTIVGAVALCVALAGSLVRAECERPSVLEPQQDVGPGWAPAIAWNGDGYGVAWIERETTELNLIATPLWFQGFDDRGNKVGDPVLITDDWGSEDPAIAWNGNGYGLTWEAEIAHDGHNRFFVRLDRNGRPVSEIRHMPMDLSRVARIEWNGDGYALVWDAFGDLVFQLRDAGGNVRVETRFGGQNTGLDSLVWNGTEYSVLWHHTNFGYFAARISSLGAVIDENLIDNATPGIGADHVWNGTSYGIVLLRGSGFDVGEMRTDLTLLPRTINAAAGIQYASLAWNGTSYAVLMSRRDRSGTFFGQFDTTGRQIGDWVVATQGEDWQRGPQLVWTGAQYGFATVPEVSFMAGAVKFGRVGCDCADGDADGVLSCDGDCADADPSVFSGATEVNDGRDNQCPGDPGHALIDETGFDSVFDDPGNTDAYSWSAQPGAVMYEVVRAEFADLTGGCVFEATALTRWVDTERPRPGRTFHYLNRALGPNAGSWGARSDGTERVTACAPW